MKTFAALLVLIGLAFVSYASSDLGKEISTQEVSRMLGNSLDQSHIRKECTVKLDFELDNGWRIEGELTFVDVTWWECTKMQIAAWWERNF